MVSDRLYKLQQNIVLLLIDKLKNGELTPERVAEIADYVLKLLPDEITDNEIKNVIPMLGTKFFELSAINHTEILQAAESIDPREKSQTVATAQELIKTGKLEDAMKLIKEYSNKNEH